LAEAEEKRELTNGGAKREIKRRFASHHIELWATKHRSLTVSSSGIVATSHLKLLTPFWRLDFDQADREQMSVLAEKNPTMALFVLDRSGVASLLFLLDQINPRMCGRPSKLACRAALCDALWPSFACDGATQPLPKRFGV
jgi:hypothetical protein